MLDRAMRHHQSGDLRQAEALYLAILEQDPAQADALHLLGLIAHRSGEPEKAIELIGQAIRRRPTAVAFHSNLGEVLRVSGQLDAAVRKFEAALAIDPNFADAHGNLGAALQTLGQSAQAIGYLRTAVRLNPDFFEAYMNLGNALKDEGRFAEAAASLQQAVRVNPSAVEAHVNLGTVLKRLGQGQEARAHYQEAIRIRPDLLSAHMSLAILLEEENLLLEARDSFHRAFQIRHGGQLWNAPSFNEVRLERAQPITEPIQTTRFELINMIEHIEYLIDKGKIDRSFAQMADQYRSVLQEVDPAIAQTELVTLTTEQATRIVDFHHQVIRYTDAPRVSACAVNEKLNFKDIERTYLSSSIAVVYFDNFLNSEALRQLRDFCLGSTIFFRRARAGVLQSYVGFGFDCSLLFQIVEELKQHFPQVLGNQVLSNMWIYRYPSEGEGVKAHTDNGSVTFNFWITPDDANLEPKRSGLVVYTKEQPLDWDWGRFNRDKDDPRVQREIGDFLASAKSVTIPYRENRAVLFHSNLFHRSDSFRFKDGYENRRMNITLLFGDRG